LTTKVKIEGLKEAQKALRKLPDATAKNVMRRVLKTHGAAIAKRAQELAPENSGDLRESIVVSTKLTKRQRKQHRKAAKDDVEVYIGAGEVPQAHLQEFGTKNHPPQPFMRPAWDGAKRMILVGIRKDLWAEIKKAAARLARKALKG
jgi:HK97 gp10 family phage protein